MSVSPKFPETSGTSAYFNPPDGVSVAALSSIFDSSVSNLPDSVSRLAVSRGAPFGSRPRPNFRYNRVKRIPINNPPAILPTIIPPSSPEDKELEDCEGVETFATAVWLDCGDEKLPK